MRTVTAFIKRHPVLAYYLLTFALSWGSVLMVLGPSWFTGAPTDVQLPLVYLAMLTGPTITGLLLTGLVRGKAGFRDLVSRLLRWRVGARWYAVALLTAPLLMMASLLALSPLSAGFLPSILVTDDKATLLLTGVAAGLSAGFFEELGWMGFAVPGLRPRHGILTTGLIVGLLWGAWHFPLFSGGDPSGAIPPALFVPVLLFSFLPAYRVLIVWLYDRTGSLLVAILMHVSLTASTQILQPLDVAGVFAMTYDLVLAVSLWVVIAAIAVANGWHLSRQPLRARAA